jgi:orotidine-5'-phosphate decarboxylase
MDIVKIEDRLIVALDFDTVAQARALVDALDGMVDFFKVGMGLGLDPEVNSFLRELIGRGKKVFLDYKYLDIEATIERAVSQAAKLGVTFLTIHHTSQGIVRAALRGRGESGLKVLAVTVLTSQNEADLRDLGYDCPVDELVLRRARQAAAWGCDGVIASGREAEAIRRAVGEDFLIVTPGIRPEGSATGDQKRSVTPAAAIAAGANALVVGRPILVAEDPVAMAKRIAAEMQSAFTARESDS